ncbi:Protein spinster 3 [Blomia tropicalis]|nr:Protein spinster 3 [Blomia tropicalis]
MIGSYFTVGILCIINLLNYMDRYTIAGVLNDIQKFFDMDKSTSGLLQTAFIVSYMIFAPVFGFLGDRYSRKILIVLGIIFWSGVTLLSSFVQQHHTYLFFICRSLVGIGEASYSTVAPTIIADLFSGKKRSTMIALFYFAIPVGSGLGYIVGSQMATIFKHWQWALRFTPVFGFICAISFIFVNEPKRGGNEGVERHNDDITVQDNHSFSIGQTIQSLKNDVYYIVSVPTYLFTTLGFTCVCFSIGALSWWTPYYMEYALVDSSSKDKINFIFGAIACVGGIVGVLIGSSSSQFLRGRYATIDPIICGVGVLISIPCTFIAIYLARSHPMISWINIFLAITFLSVNWSVVVDILLYVIVPERRATAQAIQILISHTLGDATSPFIVGAIATAITKGNPNDPDIDYISLSYSLYLAPFILIFGGLFFIFSSRFVYKDEYRCKNDILGSDPTITNNGIKKIIKIPVSTTPVEKLHL